MAHIRKAMAVQKRRAFLITEIMEQQRWIESCENNGKSYTGPNGAAIRTADNNQLYKLGKELRSI